MNQMKYGMDEHPIGREAATRLLGAMIASEPSDQNEHGVNNTLMAKWAEKHELTMDDEVLGKDAELLARIAMGNLERCIPYEDVTAEAILRMSGPLVDNLLDVEKHSQTFIEHYLPNRYPDEYGYDSPANGMTLTTTEILAVNSGMIPTSNTFGDAYAFEYALNVKPPQCMDEIIAGSTPISICMEENWIMSDEDWAAKTYAGPDVYSGKDASAYDNIPASLQVSSCALDDEMDNFADAVAALSDETTEMRLE